jgi:integrative and conjugative element protein (TIGR02256 family)
MLEYVQNKPFKHEAGGVLLGRYIKDSKDIIIDLATQPQSKDKRSRFRFFRKQEEHQAIVEQVWKESEGTCNYLGEWHTHPEPNPVPSSVDVKTWIRQVRETKFQGDCLYSVIVGTEETTLFEINKSTLKITKLSLI